MRLKIACKYCHVVLFPAPHAAPAVCACAPYRIAINGEEVRSPDPQALRIVYDDGSAHPFRVRPSHKKDR